MTRHGTAPGTLPTSTIAAARSVRIPAGEHHDAVAKKKEARPGYQREADNHSTKPAIRMNASSQHSSPLRTASTSGCSNIKTGLPPNSKQAYRREADNHSTKPAIRMNAPSQQCLSPLPGCSTRI